MYKFFRQLCERWLRIPPEPEPPPGDEASARVFRAAPKYLQYLRVLWGIRTGFAVVFATIPLLVVGGILLTSKGDKALPLVIMGSVELIVIVFLIAHALFSLAIVNLDFEKRWYLVTNRSLRIREGVATVREITFTFANIQNLSVTQGPIQRMLGIADLKVETAGGGSGHGTHQQQAAGLNLHTAYFRGIDNAEEVKQLIAARMRGYRDAGLGDNDDARASQPDTGVTAALEAVLAEAKALRLAAEQAA